MLNDDTVAPGEDFRTHPRQYDRFARSFRALKSTATAWATCRCSSRSELRVMSAGDGITHSRDERQPRRTGEVPADLGYHRAGGHTPRYNQIELAPQSVTKFRLIVAQRRLQRRKRGLDSSRQRGSCARPRCRAGTVPHEPSRKRGLCLRDRRLGRGAGRLGPTTEWAYRMPTSS